MDLSHARSVKYKHEQDLLAQRADEDIELQRRKDMAQMARSKLSESGLTERQQMVNKNAMDRAMLGDATTRRLQDFQYGKGGYYPEQNRIRELDVNLTNQRGVARNFMDEKNIDLTHERGVEKNKIYRQSVDDAYDIGMENVDNQGYQYKTVLGPNDTEAVNVYRRGEWLNKPEGRFGGSDGDKLLNDGTGKTGASVDPTEVLAGRAKASPAARVSAEPAVQRRQATFTQPGVTSPARAVQPAVSPGPGFKTGMRDVVPFKDTKTSLNWLKNYWKKSMKEWRASNYDRNAQ